MYWHTPILEFDFPCHRDPVAESSHNGMHVLFYDAKVDKTQIQINQRLQDLCDWANHGIKAQSWSKFVQDPANYYDIANLVKLNLWVHDLPINGSVKPMLLQYLGVPVYVSGTGESRLRALERIPAIQTVSAFISTHVKYRHHFTHLESVADFDRFAELCQAESGQKFLFRFTDSLAPYGIEWYEYDSRRTASVTPGQEYCLEVLTNYLNENQNLKFTVEWFDRVIDWNLYKNS